MVLLEARQRDKKLTDFGRNVTCGFPKVLAFCTSFV